jgi:DNA-binding response OmpR family regulator
MRILLVEPDHQLAKTLQAGLTQKGFDCDVAHTAQAAIHTADDNKPDIIVLELQIPSHNGVEFLYELRSYAEWQDIPVILHTFIASQALLRFKQSLAELNVVATLYKPDASFAALVAAIRSFQPVAS